jgi:eukaryotic-like serine/threonine-protein kinase
MLLESRSETLTMLSPDPSERPNELGGKYRILAELGQGGTAMVSLAVARGPSGFSKLVVLKVMKKTLLTDPEFSEMFMNEARLAARLNHPNIVQTNEVFDHQGRPVIVMEHLEGQPLSELLHRARGTQKFTSAMHIRVISDVLSGLQYAHELRDFDGTPLGVVHRDMSPHNVFVTFDGQVKLLDFGIAKLAGSRVETETGVIKGKIRYMSPEQITGENVDARADVFGIGVMLWEAAAKARMWAGMGEATIMNHLLNAELPSPKSVNPELDDELERIVMKAMAANAADRYPSAGSLQADLDEYLARFGTQVRPRDIGRVVSELFGEERAQTGRIVQAQLSKVSALSDAEYAAIDPVELTRLAATKSTTSMVRGQPSSTGQARTRGPLSYAGGALLLALAGVGVWALSAKGSAKPAPEPTPTNAPASAATEQSVELQITAYPSTARIYLDGQLLPSNPWTQRLPRDGAKHKLRFAADDHESEERLLVVERDSDVVVSLKPARKAPDAPAASAASERPKRPAARPAAPSHKVSACDPPFTVDERGIKRYKPQCL